MRSLTAWRVSLTGFALSAVVFVAVGFAAFTRIDELGAANAAVEHTLVVRTQAQQLLSLLQDAETGQRGFVITALPEYLQPYDDASAQLPTSLAEFRRLTADNPVQQANVTTLEGLIDRRLAILRDGIFLRQNNGFEEAAQRISGGEGKRVMDAARAGVARILAEEDRLMAGRVQAQQQRNRQVLVASLGGLGAAFLLLALATAFMAQAVAERERARAGQTAAETVTAAVQQSEERLRVTLDSIGDGVIATDEHGNVTDLNRVAEILTGWSQADAAGRPLASIFVIVNEHTRKPVESPVEKVWHEGKIVGLANHTVLLSRDGRQVPIDDSAAPIRAVGGDVRGVVLVFRDIGDRRTSERELKIARERLAQFVDNVPCLLWEAWGKPDAADQHIDFVSPYVEPMLGYSVKEWLATPNFWLTIVHPDDRDKAAKAAADAFSRGAGHINRFRWITKDRRVIDVETRSAVIKDEDGTPIGMRGVTVIT